jgi:integrase
MQRKIKFTDVTVKNLCPAEGQSKTVYSDLTTPGLRIRVSDTAKSWIFDYLVEGQGGRKTRTLGRYPTIGLKEARQMASETYIAAQRGVDLMEKLRDEAEARRAAREALAKRKSLRDVVQAYQKERLAHKRTGAEVGRCLERELAPYLDAPAEELTEDDLAQVLAEKEAAGVTVARRRTVRAYMRGFTKWAKQRKHIPSDPGGELPVPEGVVAERDRVLSVDEVHAIWATSEEVLTEDYRDAVRLLILTAQRRSIITDLTWGEVNLEGSCLDIGGGRTKNATASVTHLSPPARAILEARWAGQGVTEKVFRVPTLNHMKAKLDRATGIESWRYHDLRHTFATNMAERGVAAEVVDLVLHHKMGSTLSKVARIYNRAALLPDRARALDAWGEIVCPSRTKVVQLHG